MRTRGMLSTAEPAEVARVTLSETAARGRNILRSESGAAAVYRARCNSLRHSPRPREHWASRARRGRGDVIIFAETGNQFSID